MKEVAAFFEQKGWEPFDFQREVWRAYLDGKSGLLHAPTGTGKTQAVWLGPVIEYLRAATGAAGATGGLSASENGARHPALADRPPVAPKPRQLAEPLRVIWVTPLRALATDTTQSLLAPIDAIGLPWAVEKRTGDTSASLKAKQRRQLPTALVTTPESLSLLLSYPDMLDGFRGLRCVVVDEWHELVGTKRGVQTELCLARLRRLSPDLRTWGVSATLGNIDEAMRVLLGDRANEGVRVQGRVAKPITVDTLLPQSVERFPWAGHLGVKMLAGVLDMIDGAGSTLLFTNTRSQAEIWFQAILRARNDWIGEVAVHHGSLDRKVRDSVERLLAAGKLRCVVCTSSLDLGVDFSPVDRVIQVGSPKGVARLMQRAGRSGHRPGAESRVTGVPTHAMELVEFAAAREVVERREIESREPVLRPLDVLVQHLVTVALGGGFEAGDLLSEVRTSHAYAGLTDQEWQWSLDFVRRGGPALTAYPDFARVVEREGRFTVDNPRTARMHRMSIGTINSDTAMQVRYPSGRLLGTVEESFIGRMKPGDRFAFAGRTLELVRVHQMVAHVRRSKGSGRVPTWQGGRTPLSTQLAAAVRRKLEQARLGVYDTPELLAAEPLLELQKHVSRIPAPDELLIETLHDREGHHAILYPFEGRLVHEGLGALLAWRLAKVAPRSITTTCNDYGLELLSPQPLDLDERQWRAALGTKRLIDDLLEALNATQLARRRFRDIARIAGLIFPGFPGTNKPSRHLQASSELFYDVFCEFDPGNMLLDQARREVLERELEAVRMRGALERLARQRVTIVPVERLTPLAFPIWADRLREQHVSSERWRDRVARMAEQLEQAVERHEKRKARRPERDKHPVGR